MLRRDFIKLGLIPFLPKLSYRHPKRMKLSSLDPWKDLNGIPYRVDNVLERLVGVYRVNTLLVGAPGYGKYFQLENIFKKYYQSHTCLISSQLDNWPQFERLDNWGEALYIDEIDKLPNRWLYVILERLIFQKQYGLKVICAGVSSLSNIDVSLSHRFTLHHHIGV